MGFELDGTSEMFNVRPTELFRQCLVRAKTMSEPKWINELNLGRIVRITLATDWMSDSQMSIIADKLPSTSNGRVSMPALRPMLRKSERTET